MLTRGFSNQWRGGTQTRSKAEDEPRLQELETLPKHAAMLQ